MKQYKIIELWWIIQDSRNNVENGVFLGLESLVLFNTWEKLSAEESSLFNKFNLDICIKKKIQK